MNYTSKLDEVLALHPDEFRRQFCLVKTPSVTEFAVASDNGDVFSIDNKAAISGNDNDDVGTSGNVDVAWPALKYNSIMELQDHIKDSKVKRNICLLFGKLCSKKKEGRHKLMWYSLSP